MKRFGFAVVTVGLLTACTGQTASAGGTTASADHSTLSRRVSFDFVNGSPTTSLDDLLPCPLLPRANETESVALMLSGSAKLEALTRWLLIPLQRKLDKTEFASSGVATGRQEIARG